MSDNSASSLPCTNFSYGEVEDYTINITAAKGNILYTENQVESNPLSNQIFDYFTTYPNPATDYININLLENQLANVKVYNVTGSLVLNQDIDYTNTEINVSDLSKGTYIIKVTDGQKEHSSKFIKY